MGEVVVFGIDTTHDGDAVIVLNHDADDTG